MSNQKSNGQYAGPYRKPRADLYTVLLIVALIALISGIFCLYAEMAAYDFEFRGASIDAPLSHTAVAMAEGCCTVDSAPWMPARHPPPWATLT